MSHQSTIRKLEGKVDGSYAYVDADGQERSGWMPPSLLRQILQMPGVQKVTPIRIREPDGASREDFWPMDEMTAKKFADTQGIVHVMSLFEDGETKYYFVAKVVWEKEEAILAIVMNASLSEAEKQRRMKELLKR